MAADLELRRQSFLLSGVFSVTVLPWFRFPVHRYLTVTVVFHYRFSVCFRLFIRLPGRFFPCHPFPASRLVNDLALGAALLAYARVCLRVRAGAIEKIVPQIIMFHCAHFTLNKRKFARIWITEQGVGTLSRGEESSNDPYSRCLCYFHHYQSRLAGKDFRSSLSGLCSNTFIDAPSLVRYQLLAIR